MCKLKVKFPYLSGTYGLSLTTVLKNSVQLTGSNALLVISGDFEWVIGVNSG
jgi:hypothetical protein